MKTFTAVLYWPDIEDPRYVDDQEITTLLGPDGQPPTVIRIPDKVDGVPVFDVYVRDRPFGAQGFDPRDEVYYRHDAVMRKGSPNE